MKKIYARRLTSFYEAYNTAYFYGRLPQIKVYYTALPITMYGRTDFSLKTKRAIHVLVNRRLKDWLCTSLITLLHEMIHVSNGALREKDSHGKIFQRERQRLVKAGAFTRLL